MTTESLTIFLGWTTVINILVLIFSALVLLTAREKISKLHARLFGVEQANFIFSTLPSTRSRSLCLILRPI